MNLRKSWARVRTLFQKGSREGESKMERGKGEKKEEEGRGGEDQRGEEGTGRERKGERRGGEKKRGDKRTQVLDHLIHRHTSLGLAACSLGVWDRLLSEDALGQTPLRRCSVCFIYKAKQINRLQLGAAVTVCGSTGVRVRMHMDQREVKEKGKADTKPKCR